MIVSNISTSNYAVYRNKEKKQAPSFGFNPLIVIKNEGTNLALGAAVSHFTNLPLLNSFILTKSVTNALTVARNTRLAGGSFNWMQTITNHNSPSNLYRPVIATIDAIGGLVASIFRKP